MEIRLYFEGDDKLRRGFRTFFSRMALGNIRPVATNGTPVQDYEDGLRSHPAAINLLLLDSDEMPERRAQLSEYPKERVFWMIEMMESWFLADKAALKKFYRRDFNESALPPRQDVEKIAKRDVENGLREFSRHTKKGLYHKTKHAPDILELIDPALVRKAASECERLFQVLGQLARAE
jgi:hypothetical protein